jgi:antitoxin (DNA-binding transcriptional repressor) of toxin-antitoxin stability system
MKTINATRSRRIWSRLLSRVAHGGERIAIHRSGNLVAALVPIPEAELLDALAHESDIEEARKAIRSDRGKPPVEWGAMKRFTEIDR